MANFKLELLHIADQEAGSTAIQNAPNLSAVLNALRAQDLGNDGLADGTLTLSSGDAFIPGLFFDASAPVYGSGGIADIEIQNQLGIQAIAIGNHEFDFGTQTLADLISGNATGSILDADFAGAAFPYLSSNLDFSTDPNLAPLEVDGGESPLGNTVTSSVILDVNGESILVVGATTPTLASISSPGTVGISPEPFGGNPSDSEIAVLAEVIQAEINAVLELNPTLNKVILLAHMQRLNIEQELAGLLSNVDIIVAGGSNTRLLDADDVLREGDTSQGTYPIFVTNADGGHTAVVNTDGSYKYVGRLVVDFDEEGRIIAESYDAAVSGAYATDDAGVDALDAAELVDPEIQRIVDEIGAQIFETEGNVFGVSDVFLNGNRSGSGEVDDTDGVRTQETNLGNLTAEANLAEAQKSDSSIVISIKNGGGIRASIGETVVLAGDTEASRNVNQAVENAEGVAIKPEGGISQNDIQTTLAFNNDLVTVTLTRSEIVELLEHGVSALPGVAGAFPQLAGVKVAFDVTAEPGDRVTSAVIVDENDQVIAKLVENGELAGFAGETFGVVTLGFLLQPRFDAEGNFIGGGDGYPFPNINTDPEVGEVADPDVVARINVTKLLQEGIRTGNATFADNGTEQDALAEYLSDNFATPDTAYDKAETGPGRDDVIQQAAFRTDTVGASQGTNELAFSVAKRFDSGSGETGAEIAAHENGKAYVTNGAENRIDVFDMATGVLDRSLNLSGLSNFGGVQSVAVKNGIVAVAVSKIAEEGDVALDGVIAFFDTSGTLIGEVSVGNLPDMVTFTPDGTTVLVANEGEPLSAEIDPAGSISMIDISGGIASATAVTLDFVNVDLSAARIVGDRGAALDIEPEYIAVNSNGTRAYASLQEANAYATIDLTTNTIIDVKSFGTVDHSLAGNEIDTSDRDNAINITSRPVQGLRMPDSIAAFAVDGTTYLLTANEGDARDLDADEIRLRDAADDGLLDAVLLEQLEEAGLLSNAEMGRLNISRIDGDIDNDGDIDVLHSFGSRGFTIFNADTGAVVFDSGSQFARIVADARPGAFNDDAGTDNENRSDNKGVEPEAITFGVINGRTIAFIGLERDGGIMAYDVSDPAEAKFLTYFNGFEDGDISPEGFIFISAEESTTGKAQLLAAYEVSGTTVAYDLTEITKAASTETYTGALADYSGASFTGVDAGDVFLFNGDTPFTSGAISTDTEARTITINGTTFNTDADFTDSNVLAARTGTQETTVKVIENLLGDGIDLIEGQAVTPSEVDGIVFREFLTGDGALDFTVTVDKSTSGYKNGLGVYEYYASTQTARNVQILFDDMGAANGHSMTLSNVSADAQLVFFLLQDAVSVAMGLSDDLSFDFSGLRPVLQDGGTAVDVEIFHSLGADFNSDGVEHFLSGVVNGGGAMRVGVEDLLGGGDLDYQDAVFTVVAEYDLV